MQKTFKQLRSWLAITLAMMLLVSGLFPFGVAFAAPNVVTTPGSFISGGAASTSSGSSAAPVQVISKMLRGVTVKFGTTVYNTKGITVKVGSSTVANTSTISTDTVILPDLNIDPTGGITKVTVTPNATPAPPATDIATIYYQYVPTNSGSKLVITDSTGATELNGANYYAPIVTSSRTLTGLSFKYNNSAGDPVPSVQIRLNGKVLQTLTTTSTPQAKSDNTQVTSNTNIDLTPGLNSIQVYANNTGEYDIIYYQYGSSSQPVTVTGYVNGKTAYDPIITGDSKFTINGTYGSGVVGENLRMKIVTNNGQSVQDLSSTTPTINGNNFTFQNVPLSPGLNEITFYSRVGNITNEYISLYVQYNNTPLVTDLAINSVSLILDSTTPTFITVPSPTRLNLQATGSAKNADTVKITNTTTGDIANATVSTSGKFGTSVQSVLGKNVLQFVAMNQNKEVGVIQRTILVSAASAGSADQFYQVQLEEAVTSPLKVDLDAQKTAVVNAAATGGKNTNAFTLNASMLLQYIDVATQSQFNKFRVTILDSQGAAIANIPPVDYRMDPNGNGDFTDKEFTIVGNPQSGYTQYQINANNASNPSERQIIIPTDQLVDGQTYQIVLSYEYLTPDSTGTLNQSNWVTVNSYKYKFKFTDKSKPVFGQVLNGITRLPLVPAASGVNTVSTSSLPTTVYTYNMGTGSGKPDQSKFRFYYTDAAGNTTTLANGSGYVWTNDVQLSSVDNSGSVDVQLNKLPSGIGTLKIEYDPDGAGTTADGDEVSASYKLDVQITPYVQLTYVDGNGQVQPFEDGFKINTDNDIRPLDGVVYNYDIISASDIDVVLNGNVIDPSKYTVNFATDSFNIPKSVLLTTTTPAYTGIIKGNNTLKIILKKDPKTTFSYDIFYNTSKAPTISDIKLQINKNNDDQELEKNTTDSSYSTDSEYLSDFSFSVNGANHVYVEKNGKRIIDYRNDGDWNLDDTNQEYVDNRLDAVNANRSSIQSNLEDSFDQRNFDPSGSKFEAEMTASQYGSLIDDVQQAVSDVKVQDQKLALFPLTLVKNGDTVYTIVAEDENGSVIRYDVRIKQNSASWTVISPLKRKDSDPYIVVNTNSVPIKIFALNATSVSFGKTQAKVGQIQNPDYSYDRNTGKVVPGTYYVFTATVPLKVGLNTIKYTVAIGSNSYNDQIQIYNANSSVNGAEYRDLFGKKTSFSVFGGALSLKFPIGTTLLSPSDKKAGSEVKNPNGDIFVDVPLYFGIADRTTGQVMIDDNDLEDDLVVPDKFNYASPLYYVDAGDTTIPGGRDPYYADADADDFKDRYPDNLVPSREGTVTIKYDPSIVNAANNILSVHYNDGSGWKILGGVVNTSSKTITTPFQGFGYYMVMKNRDSFDDVIGHPYARDAMETLYAKGIMPAKSGSNFGANDNISRGEFATMVVKALDLPLNDGPYNDSRQQDPLEPTFQDVKPRDDSWDYEYKYIETAARAGIIRGSASGLYSPEAWLTREQAAGIIARAMNMKLTTPELAKPNVSKMFTDAQLMDFYFLPSVLSVTKAKIMNGEMNDPTAKKPTWKFNPRGNLTRAEMAVITQRIMVQLKKLPKQ